MCHVMICDALMEPSARTINQFGGDTVFLVHDSPASVRTHPPGLKTYWLVNVGILRAFICRYGMLGGVRVRLWSLATEDNVITL
jgi:hypothetical protein